MANSGSAMIESGSSVIEQGAEVVENHSLFSVEIVNKIGIFTHARRRPDSQSFPT